MTLLRFTILAGVVVAIGLYAPARAHADSRLTANTAVTSPAVLSTWNSDTLDPVKADKPPRPRPKPGPKDGGEDE